MSHEHLDCVHDLCYCEHCDIVYCKKCKREWGKKEYIYIPYYQPQYPIYWSYPPVTVCNTDNTVTIEECCHST